MYTLLMLGLLPQKKKKKKKRRLDADVAVDGHHNAEGAEEGPGEDAEVKKKNKKKNKTIFYKGAVERG